MKSLFFVGASAVSLAVFSAAPAAAQGTSAQANANPIDYCRETSATDKDEIACLRAAVAALLGADKAAASAEGAPEGVGEKRLAAPEADAQESGGAATAETDVEADGAPAAVAQAKAEPAPTGLGAEQVERRQRRAEKADSRDEDDGDDNEDEQIVEAAVVEFATTSIGDVLFILDNGQIWRKKKSERVHGRLLNSRDYTVKISEGFFSGYRMRINELGETVTVERVK